MPINKVVKFKDLEIDNLCLEKLKLEDITTIEYHLTPNQKSAIKKIMRYLSILKKINDPVIKSLVKKITFYIYLILKRLDLSLCLNDVKDEAKSTQKMIEGTPSFINKDKINEMCLKDDEVKLDSEFLVDIFKNYLLEKINNKCDYDKYVMKLKKYLNCL